MSIGKTLVEAGMAEELEVSWVPSYGPEMRGGTANCSVILSDSTIGSPIIYNPTELIAMNTPSLKKFEADVVPGGTIFLNSSIISEPVEREDVRVVRVPCDRIAGELGNPKVANMVMLGAYIAATGALKTQTIQEMLTHMFTGKKAQLVPLNMEAMSRGAACAEE